MTFVVGLGNPGKKYEQTRHNLGFMIVNALALEMGLKFRFNKTFNAEVAKNSDFTLIKPLTYMNDSGSSIRKLFSQSSVPREELLVVHDDIDLKLGQLRISINSGSAGHHGVESLVTALGRNFPRLRLGIEARENRATIPTETYVLQKFTTAEKTQIKNQIIPDALDKIKSMFPNESTVVRKKNI